MRAAAEELMITSSAVSHQVRTLETFVGTSLFERGDGHVCLSETGRAYFREIGSALDMIEASTLRAARRGESNLLTIHMQASLLELWFVPLLRDFTAAYPALQVSVVSDASAADFANGIADLAIEYGRSTSDDPPLIEESIVPVCSDSFLANAKPLDSPSDLARHPLIWCDTEPDEWQQWFSANGVSDAAATRWIAFDLRAAALQAAREGLGIAMGRRPYMDVALQRRKLVMPFDIKIKTGFGYRIVTPPRSEYLEKTKLFKRWLLRRCNRLELEG